MANDRSDLVYFNGLNGSTGGYLTPPLYPEQLSQMARGERFDAAQLAEFKWRKSQREAQYAVKEGVDPKDLAQTGWGVIFAALADPGVKDALGELLLHRRQQANRVRERYREYSGTQGFQPGDTKNAFLARLGAGPGPVDPDIVPYYLLIVGGPDAIPYSFQAQLDVAYAVGRIYFDTLDDYAQYAHSIVEAERRDVRLPRTAAFFGVQNEDDGSTDLSATHLVQPLAQQVQADQPGWSVQTLMGQDATKARLAALVGGEQTPALLFTASHGIGFDPNDPRQYPHQGALVCQDWPGPVAGRDIPCKPDWYFAAEDVSRNARLFGLISFHFACYGAGTPQYDEFVVPAQGGRARTQIAPFPFVAGLPRRLLAHPNGGALAVIGHVERAWGTSFLWDQAGAQRAVFQSTLKRLMEGHPVGSALEFLNARYAELSTLLSSELEEARFGKRVDAVTLSGLWTAHNDARGYAVIGDPAVRLAVGDSAPAERPVVESIRLAAASRAGIPAPVEQEPASLQPPAREAPVPEAMAAIPGAGAAPPGDYGLLDAGVFRQVETRLMASFQLLADRLGHTLSQVVDDTSSVEIRTYVSDDLSRVSYERGQFTGDAALCAITHVALGGDTDVVVPKAKDQMDEALWAVHLSMVQQAQIHRTEFIRTLVSAATGLLGVIKGE